MDRRGFLRTLVGGVAVGAAVRSWPFRVYSFPSAPVGNALTPEMLQRAVDLFQKQVLLDEHLRGLAIEEILYGRYAWMGISREIYPQKLFYEGLRDVEYTQNAHTL